MPRRPAVRSPMEALTRLVSESLARHGFDRPLDYRRLQWSRWFRCESPHSLLLVPSRPGVFALAEEMMEFDRGATDASSVPRSGASGPPEHHSALPMEQRPFSVSPERAHRLDGAASNVKELVEEAVKER